MIYIAADHGGFKLKQHLARFLQKQKLDFKDLGPAKFKDGDDYPDFGAKVAKQVSKNPVSNLGILICRSGQGMCIVANKYPRVRAVLVWNQAAAKVSRNDDMANILCLPSDFMNYSQAESILKTWLNTAYSTEPRHMRRVHKISKIEESL